jgi:large conductance mechanosensitive channel
MLKSILEDFKIFIMRGSVIDLAVGVIIGVAFGAIVTSLVNDVIMPPIGIVLHNTDFGNLMIVLKQGTVAGPYASLAAAKAAGAVTINYGAFINTLINFLILGVVVFLVVVRPIARMNAPKKNKEPAAPTTKECPYCITAIPLKATRCPHCTSELK